MSKYILIVTQTTENGTINGKFDINNKLIDASFSEFYSAYWEKINNTVNSSGTSRMSGALDEINNASGTINKGSWGSIWSASPY